MSNVPKSRRSKSNFETDNKLKDVRSRISEICYNKFGYNKEKLDKDLDREYEFFKKQKSENGMKGVERKREKNNGYYEDFVEREKSVVEGLIRKVALEFESGNSIFPSGISLIPEYIERRMHMNRAIENLNCIKQELQFIAEVIPGDKSRYDNVIEGIKELSALIKGVRQSGNRFLKSKKKESFDNEDERSLIAIFFDFVTLLITPYE